MFETEDEAVTAKEVGKKKNQMSSNRGEKSEMVDAGGQGVQSCFQPDS